MKVRLSRLAQLTATYAIYCGSVRWCESD